MAVELLALPDTLGEVEEAAAVPDNLLSRKPLALPEGIPYPYLLALTELEAREVRILERKAQ